jgi:hypothetical protein
MEKARNISSPKSGNKMLPKPEPSAGPILPDKDKDKDRAKFGNKMLPNLEGVPTGKEICNL